jgi:Protein of unknown function (DUF3306)
MSSESFLSRWSRRKQEVREAEQTEGVPPPLAEPGEQDYAPEAAASSDPPAGEAAADVELTPDEIARLPSIDELTADMDLSVFLRKGVPEALRNAALRRMWSLDPKIRDYVSEAREYAYDWNTPGGVPGFGGALPPTEEVRKLAERIVGGQSSREVGSAEPDSEIARPSADRNPAGKPEAQVSLTTEQNAGREPLQPPEEHAKEPIGVAVVNPPQPVPLDAGEAEGQPASPRRRHGGAKPC